MLHEKYWSWFWSLKSLVYITVNNHTEVDLLLYFVRYCKWKNILVGYSSFCHAGFAFQLHILMVEFNSVYSKCFMNVPTGETDNARKYAIR